MNIRVCLTLMAFAAVGVASATTTAIYDPSLLKCDATVSWNAYNPDYTTGTLGYFPFGTNAAWIDSVNNFTGVPDAGVMEIRTEGPSWFGEFNPGDGVLYFHNDYSLTSSVFHIQFVNPVQGFALQGQSNAFGAYTIFFGVWNGAFPGGSALTFGSTSGVNSGSEAGTQGWFGASSDMNEITDVYVAVVMNDGSETFGSGFGPMCVGVPVPEPASVAALGIGALALLRRRRS